MADIVAARVAMMRALYEGASVTFEALSLISGKKLEIIEAIALKSKWEKKKSIEYPIAILPEIKKNDYVEQKKRVSSSQTGITAKENKKKIIPDRNEETVNSFNPQKKEEEQKNEDADLASLFERIDDRIVELAKEYARHLVAEEYQKISST